jgi:hypothetical protein
MALIDESLFEGCRSLTTVDLPRGLTKISRRAFKGCSSLKSLILPSQLRSIGFDAFAGCTSLSRIAIPKDVAEIEDSDVFSACDSLTEISFGGSREAWELLNHGKIITVEESDLSVHTPRVVFLNLNGKAGGKNEV